MHSARKYQGSSYTPYVVTICKIETLFHIFRTFSLDLLLMEPANNIARERDNRVINIGAELSSQAVQTNWMHRTKHITRGGTHISLVQPSIQATVDISAAWKKLSFCKQGSLPHSSPTLMGLEKANQPDWQREVGEEYLQNESNFQQREHHHSPADFIQCELKMQGKFSRRLATEGLGHHGARGDVVKHSLQSFRSEAGT